jgi:hypothetical protein
VLARSIGALVRASTHPTARNGQRRSCQERIGDDAISEISLRKAAFAPVARRAYNEAVAWKSFGSSFDKRLDNQGGIEC